MHAASAWPDSCTCCPSGHWPRSLAVRDARSRDRHRRTPRRRPPDPPGLVGRRCDVPRARRGRRVPGRARRADRPAAGGVRLVDRHDLGRGRRQPGALRAHRAVRRRAHGAVRHPPGRDGRAARRRGGQRPDRVHDRELAARAAVGRARRRRHRVDGARAGRDGHRAVVRRPPRARLGDPHRRRGDRAAGVPAAGRRGRRGVRVAGRGARGGRRGAGRRAVRGLAAARPARATSAPCPTAAPRADDVDPVRTGAGAARRARARRRGAHRPVLVPRWPGWRSAAPRRTG